jgi:hypothetical protein
MERPADTGKKKIEVHSGSVTKSVESHWLIEHQYQVLGA